MDPCASGSACSDLCCWSPPHRYPVAAGGIQKGGVQNSAVVLGLDYCSKGAPSYQRYHTPVPKPLPAWCEGIMQACMTSSLVIT